jgi:enterochelin esterase-like enzyme
MAIGIERERSVLRGFGRIGAAVVAALAVWVLPHTAVGQPGLPEGQTVTFTVTQATTFGQSVYVLGTPSALGGVDPSLPGADLSRSVKLDPSAYPLWRVSVSLPRGLSYTYRFYLRSDGPGQSSQPTNGTPISPVLAGSTDPWPPGARRPSSKSLVITWNAAHPALYWRVAGSAGAYQRVDLERYGPAPGRPSDTWWYTAAFAPVDAEVEFYLTGAGGAARSPTSGVYTTALAGIFVQDGQVFSYVPSPVVGPSRRDYSPASPPTLFAPSLNQTRAHRVYLPRGYDQHPHRRYPVLFMHDGQNIFESGPFGSWNAAPTIQALQAGGRLREIIVVGLDNVGSTRINDYTAPGDGGRADAYTAYILGQVRPLIDAQYRTLTDARLTGSAGSSMGGVVAMYHGWDHPGAFGRVGNFSPAWQVVPGLTHRVKTEPARDLRIYLDSGDSGTSSDNYWPTFGVRDAWVGAAPVKYALEGPLRHVVGFGQQHNEAAWASRLPGALRFLYPAEEEPNDIVRFVIGAHWDTDADGRITVEDVYGVVERGADINLDAASSPDDAGLVERFVRREESAGMRGAQRP